jgi:NGP1NT (NUC091) domain
MPPTREVPACCIAAAALTRAACAVQLLEDPEAKVDKKRKRREVLQQFSFAETFGAKSGQRQKRPKVAVEDYEALVATAEARAGQYGEKYEDTADADAGGHERVFANVHTLSLPSACALLRFAVLLDLEPAVLRPGFVRQGAWSAKHSLDGAVGIVAICKTQACCAGAAEGARQGPVEAHLGGALQGRRLVRRHNPGARRARPQRHALQVRAHASGHLLAHL